MTLRARLSRDGVFLRPILSWFSGDCRACGYPAVVTQSARADYCVYCSNPYCANHHSKKHIADSDFPPDFVTMKGAAS